MIRIVLFMAIFLTAGKAFAWQYPTNNQSLPANYYSEYPDVMLHTTIRPKAKEVEKEKEVQVDRHIMTAEDAYSDPQVLYSGPKPVATEPTVDPDKVAMAERINELEGKLLEKQAKEVTGSLVDDNKVEY